ncbi:tetratricopeptide repeat protein 36-like [Liolophura sinensis]|uniref:tetratricopeptide repeat protein 36-like n=1 Tax=Liolophura sinensis TaxID=3198878 RepID=UPI0031588EC5
MASSREDVQISLHDKAVLERIFNPNLPNYIDEDEKEEESLETEDDSPVVKESKALEIEGVKLAEKGDVTAALEKFNNAINLMSDRASGYNNRAQALRLKGDTQGALCDLNRAIELSKGRGKTACQALTQRALIKKLEGDCDGALEDFKLAADLGGKFAKQQVVSMNPYAALCNQMLSEVMNKLKYGEQ